MASNSGSGGAKVPALADGASPASLSSPAHTPHPISPHLPTSPGRPAAHTRLRIARPMTCAAQGLLVASPSPQCNGAGDKPARPSPCRCGRPRGSAGSDSTATRTTHTRRPGRIVRGVVVGGADRKRRTASWTPAAASRPPTPRERSAARRERAAGTQGSGAHWLLNGSAGGAGGGNGARCGAGP